MQFLDFEQPIADLQGKITALRSVESGQELDLVDELEQLEAKSRKLTESIFSKLSDWQIIQLARHPMRPYTNDYIDQIVDDFDELHGDRNFGDDAAIVGGIGRIDGRPIMLIGQQKGRDTKAKLHRNFGMPHPEGYRKALRLMKFAEQFAIPVLTLLDTPGAYPGINAEARGQSEAIARNLREMSELKVPVCCVIIGEGCSGGALGMGVGDCLMMLKYSYFATISPEGCASILWKDAEYASKAAEIMGITSNKLKKNGVIDRVIDEPLGGAHRDPAMAGHLLKTAVLQELEELQAMPIEDLLKRRYDRLMNMGHVS